MPEAKNDNATQDSLNKTTGFFHYLLFRYTWYACLFCVLFLWLGASKHKRSGDWELLCLLGIFALPLILLDIGEKLTNFG